MSADLTPNDDPAVAARVATLELAVVDLTERHARLAEAIATVQHEIDRLQEQIDNLVGLLKRVTDV